MRDVVWPIYNEIHPQEKLGNRCVHKQFLLKLSQMIPYGKRVIIVTDGGFATPWFKAVLSRGWDFVGRINRNLNMQYEGQTSWIGTKALEQQASARVRYCGTGRLGKKVSKPVTASMYSYKQSPKGRSERSPYPDVNQRYSLLNKKAWIVATSLCPKNFLVIKLKTFIKNACRSNKIFVMIRVRVLD